MAIILMVECIILALVNDGLAPELAPEVVPGKNYGYYWFILIRKRLAYFLVFLCSGSVLDIFISNVF